MPARDLARTRNAASACTPYAWHELRHPATRFPWSFVVGEEDGRATVQESAICSLSLQFTRAHGRVAGDITTVFSPSEARPSERE